MHDKVKRTRAYSFLQGQHWLCLDLSRVPYFLICSHDRSRTIHHFRPLNPIRCHQDGRGSAAPFVEPRKIKKSDLKERKSINPSRKINGRFITVLHGRRGEICRSHDCRVDTRVTGRGFVERHRHRWYRPRLTMNLTNFRTHSLASTGTTCLDFLLSRHCSTMQNHSALLLPIPRRAYQISIHTMR